MHVRLDYTRLLHRRRRSTIKAMDRAQLPFMIQLLDDETPVVQQRVMEALASFGDELDAEIERQEIELDDERRELLEEVYAIQRREWLLERWQACMTVPDEKVKLETALGLIAEYELGEGAAARLTGLLDGLAEDYRRAHVGADVFTLAHYLFRTRELSGCGKDDYYTPAASNLVSVITRGRGLPISLSCVYLLVGARLGLDIEGCNVPNHFLARAVAGDRLILVDCFNGGATLDVAQLIPKGHDATDQLARIRRGTPAATIMLRVAANLAVAHNRAGNESDARFFTELRDQTA
jgi:hypothetical protein